jgi:cell division septation protein DedD
MNRELEALALLTEMSLPEGYRVRAIRGQLYVFDPQGIPLHGPKDPSLLETYAWRHAWRQIERELNQEVADLHAGVRPLHALRRLRQYLHMLDEAAGGMDDREQRKARQRAARTRAFAAGALVASAAAAAVLLLLPLGPDGTQERMARLARFPASRPGPAILAKHSAPVSSAKPASERSAGARGRRAATGVAASRRTGARRPASARYAVSFGQFVDAATAENMMHEIRRKGYVVYVARIGDDFLVVTAPYRSRAQAERLAGALQEIGLPAQLAPAPRI